jgi:hypothetical protein
MGVAIHKKSHFLRAGFKIIQRFFLAGRQRGGKKANFGEFFPCAFLYFPLDIYPPLVSGYTPVGWTIRSNPGGAVVVMVS